MNESMNAVKKVHAILTKKVIFISERHFESIKQPPTHPTLPKKIDHSVPFLYNASISDKTLETYTPVFQYPCHNGTLRVMYKLPSSPSPYNAVLAMILAHTTPVVFKTMLKEGRQEERRYLICSKAKGLIKDNRKIRACFLFVSSRFVRSCSFFEEVAVIKI